MEQNIHSEHCSIYPGEYVPLLNEERMIAEVKQLKKKNVFHPSVNIAEFPEEFRVELLIPGVTREQILVHANKHALLIFAARKNEELPGRGKLMVNEFKYEGVGKRIQLPKNADTGFACAEYRSGVLRLHVPKTKTPVKNPDTTIVVY
ncbi:MAG: Hsp20/alpha crystallin family protein [Bacteroidetes bacterium]|nr:Hsp20/alpha crystallin family protein [Bacteroidota bacterium]